MLTRLAFVLLALAATACSDDDSSVCTGFTFAACGGEVVGAWGGASLCPTGSESRSGPIEDDPACSTSTATERQSVSVSYQFNADGTYSQTEITAESGTYRFNDACIAIASEGIYTSAAAACSSSDIPDNWTCTMCGEFCSCRYSDSSSDTTTGTYSTSGNSITLGWSTYEYCVVGDQLQLARGDVVDGQTHIILRRQ